jgi:hypothetical protein
MRTDFMKNVVRVLCLVSGALTGGPDGFAGADTTPATASVASYAIVERVAGPPTSLWDYAAIDATARRLYLASGGVMTLDLNTGKSIANFAAGKTTHGVLPLGENAVAMTDGAEHTVKIVDSTTGKVLHVIPAEQPHEKSGWHNPDALLLEPQTGLLVAVNGDSGTLLLIDQKEARVVDRIKVGGELEFAAADGKGDIYVNVVSGNSIALVDIAHRKMIKKITLQGCDGPSGMAFDADDGLVMSVCDNGVAKFVNAETGTEVASVAVAKGADALLYDARRHVAFVPGGDEGQLSIVSVNGPGHIRVIQTLTTQPGTRLGAVDPNTGRVYLPTVKRDPTAPPLKLPGLEPIAAPIPASFEFLVVAPQSGNRE